MSKHIVIIGAGVAGLGIGWKLAKLGHQVDVYEKELIGSGASTAAGGMLAPTAEVRFEETAILALGQKSLAEWPQFAADLERDSGINVDYRDYGTLVIAVDRDDLEYISHMFKYQKELGLDCELLDGASARGIEPGLSGSIPGALWCPTDHNVDPILLTKALAAAISNLGGVVREHSEITEIIDDSNGSHCGVRLADGTDVHADVVVVAAGSWTKTIRNLPSDAPKVRPVKGQMLALGNYALTAPTNHRKPLIRHVLRGPDAYLIPRSDGRIIIGATTEEMGWDSHQTAGGVFELLRGAWEVFPGVYDTPLLDMWVGFRPTTLDNDPVLRWSSEGALFYATGFGRNGILLSAWSANRGSELILERF